MKLLDFDMNRARWDDYKRFYNTDRGPFVQFSTGELIATRQALNKDQRCHYSQFDITITATTERDCPALFTPEDEPVKTAWFGSRCQELLIDHDTKHVVRLGRLFTDGMPADLATHYGTMAYFPGPGLPPVGGHLIETTRPWLTHAHWRHLREIRDACRAWHQLGRHEKWLGPDTNPDWASLLLTTFDRMDDKTRLFVALHKGEMKVPGHKTTYPYLMVS